MKYQKNDDKLHQNYQKFHLKKSLKWPIKHENYIKNLIKIDKFCHKIIKNIKNRVFEFVKIFTEISKKTVIKVQSPNIIKIYKNFVEIVEICHKNRLKCQKKNHQKNMKIVENAFEIVKIFKEFVEIVIKIW